MTEMKRIKNYAAMALGLVCSLFAASCDNDDNDAARVSQQVQTAFAQRYPAATSVTWETKGEYAVASFRLDNECEAWFGNSSGEWQLTETDLRYADLPEAVRTAHESGEYAGWRIDEAERLERPGVSVVYTIEVEKTENGTETEIVLHYAEDGTLLRAGSAGGSEAGTALPALTESMRRFIAEHYPDARIADVDAGTRRTEVDIIDNGTKREVCFDATGTWIGTTTDVRLSQLPAAVAERLAADYPAYGVDDAEWVVSPDGSWYRLELEDRLGNELTVCLTADGLPTQG